MALSYGFALASSDSSGAFADAIHAVIGDGVCNYGGKFEIALTNSFAVNLATGFAIVNGRYLRSDAQYRVTIPASGNNADRYDAIAIRVDYDGKKVGIEVMVDIDPVELRSDKSAIRNENEYSVILYILHIKRGATTLYPEDVTDTRFDENWCGEITQFDSLSNDVQSVYQFLQSGIDDEVDRLSGLLDRQMQIARDAIAEIDAAINNKGQNTVGDVMYSKNEPEPWGHWLLCNGGEVPESYQELYTLLGGTLPNIETIGTRYNAYIYGGAQ